MTDIRSSSEGITCYERDEILCQDKWCMKNGCQIIDEPLSILTTRKIRWGFKSKHQLALFMIWEEFWQRCDVVHANVLFSSRHWIGL